MNGPRYTSNLQKGGALVEASALLVSAWDDSLSVDGNLAMAVGANLFGAASAVRRRDLVDRILRPRLVDPGPHVMSALKVLLDTDGHAFRDACYFEASRAEPLLADFAEGPMFDWYTAGRTTITVADVEPWLVGLLRTGSAPNWSAAVRARVGRALLATLRDFGVLGGVAGGTRKQIGHPYPSVPGFAYTCWRLHELGVTAPSLEGSPVWRRWLLGPADVGALMTDLAGHGVILLNRAGSITRIEWRATTLSEAVHAAA